MVFKNLKNHPTPSLTQPEARSTCFSISFNCRNLATFFENLKLVLDKYQFAIKDVWNADERVVKTVQQPSKIVAEKGRCQIGKATSTERGQAMKTVTAVNAIGNFIPSLFFLRRVLQKEFYSVRTPGFIDKVYPAGWMTESSFFILSSISPVT